MRKGLTITPIWYDIDVVEYRIEASNGAFCGTAEVYAQHGIHNRWANLLSGFPWDADDRRQLHCGSTSPKQAGGFADLCFSCVNASGHAALEIVLVSEWNSSGEPLESVRMQLKITAAAVDRFVEELKALVVEPGNSAYLPMEP